MIELDKLSKTFTQKNGKEFRAVDSVSLTVEKGEICIFLGPSGCGKTTTLKMINRIIPPTSGRVLIDGQDTADLDEVTLRRHIGYVIQQIGLFPNMTIEENIMVVPRLLGWDKARCKEKARELMSMVKLGQAVPATLPARTLRRPAAARRGNPRAGGGRAAAADGRAVRRGRSDQPRVDPERVLRNAAQARHDRDHGQPRHRRSHQAG